MSIQAQIYPENFPLIQMRGGGGSQDWMMMMMMTTTGVDNGYGGGVCSQDWMTGLENGCHGGGAALNPFCYNDYPDKPQQLLLPPPQQQQQQQRQQEVEYIFGEQQPNLVQKQPSMMDDFNGGSVFSTTSLKNTMTTVVDTTTTTAAAANIDMGSYFSTLGTQLERDKEEIDGYLEMQNERLRLALQQQRRQQLSSLVRKLETRAGILLRQKDAELSKASKRNVELEELMKKVGAENHAWKTLAFEKEAAVLSLNNTLQQLLKESHTSTNRVEEDAGSCCDFNGQRQQQPQQEQEEAEDGGASWGRRNRGRAEMVCKCCNSRDLCVLFLPCSHLCSCKACAAFLHACPVCDSVKEGTIEAFIS